MVHTTLLKPRLGRYWSRLILVVGLLAFVLPANALVDPGFEENGNALSPWSLSGQAAFTSDVAHTGNRCVKISAVDNNLPNFASVLQGSGELTLKPNTKYEVAYWARSTDTIGGNWGGETLAPTQSWCHVIVSFYKDAGGKTFVGDSGRIGWLPAQVLPGWTRMSARFKTTSDAAFGSLTFAAHTNNAGSGETTLYIDDVELIAHESTTSKVSARPMHEGRISPMLFGNFIELLDDVVPGMWAQMLNDRSFEGITKRSDWCYYEGAPGLCDREWDVNNTWTRESKGSFNGSKCVKLSAMQSGQATISQSGLAVRKGQTYLFSGYLKAASNDARCRVVLKAKLPTGKWMELASTNLPKPSGKWTKISANLLSIGTTDRAVFGLEATGKGDLWADKLSLMPSNNKLGWRPDVIQAIKEMRPGVVRWGGSVCDPGAYRWKSGIGNRDLRIPFPNKLWGRIDPNDVGIDEFCQFCELTEVEPLVCLSFSDGPESAADMVEYCNGGADTKWGALRAANGHPKPYKVKYWQLGNEIGGTDYSQKCVGFCKAMKQVDPSILLMSSFPSQDLLDLAGKDLAYISPHHYTPDFAGCENDFKNLSAMVRKTPGCEGIRIAVTEWNITASGWGIARGKLMNLDCAVQNSRYLNLLMRYSNVVDIACRSNMTNSMCSGVIETKPDGLLKRPSYYSMKLYADHIKPIPLAVEGAPDQVDVAACRSENGKRMCVFAVNTALEPIELTLDLSEYGGKMRPVSGDVLRDTEDRRQPDVMNSWTAPGRVKIIKLKVDGNKIILPALSSSAIECCGG